MVRRKIGSTLATCGIVMVLFSVSALPAQGAAPSPVRMAPSPRPALAQDRRSNDALLMGHITGTVIDLNSGAPAADVAVNVGGVLVQSDANGNYDHWLPVGTYTVTLALADGQGASAQDVMTVAVLADVATVQHLNFRSQPGALVAPTAVAAQPAAVPTAVAAQPAAAPTAVAGNAAVVAVESSSVTPNRLPVTSENSNAAWLWLAVGMALLLTGSLVGFGPGRSPAMLLGAQAANSALLRGLLAAPLPAARPTTPRAARASEDLLASLLAAEVRERDGKS
jgi:hypothetical protein